MTSAPTEVGSHEAATRTVAPTRAQAIITTEKLSKTFSLDKVQQHVLRNIDLEVREGEFTVIMGPSGSGKSTLMYALSGMDTPTLGRVVFAGEDISKYSQNRLAKFRRKHCGFVFQQVHLLDWLTVMDNAMSVGLLTGEKRRDVAARARELFGMVGLPESAWGKFPAMLSGGEGQRAALVRALMTEPDVLFADEPTGQLNSQSSTLVLDLLTRVARQGQTVVMVTHDLRSALRGDRVLYLRDGAIQGEQHLAPWTGEDDARQHQLTDFLDEMGW